MSEGTFCDQCGQRLRGGHSYLRLEVVGEIAGDFCDLPCLRAWAESETYAPIFARCAARRP